MEVYGEHRFGVEALDLAGRALGNYELPHAAFEPAARSVHLTGMRQGSAAVCSSLPPVHLMPLFSRALGAPYVDGFEVILDGGVLRGAFPASLLHDDVVLGAQVLVERGALARGDRFCYRIHALHEAAGETLEHDSAPFHVEPVMRELAVRAMSLPHGQQHGPLAGGDDIPVVIRRNVLHEAVAQCAAGGNVERGGMLLGNLCRDPGSGELFVEIGALLPALGAQGTELSLRFSPDTFAELEQTLACRAERETVLGWFHGHPDFCRQCPADRRRNCRYRQPFFSDADRDVHRSLFPQAYSQALLISDLGGPRPAIDLFSWRDGAIHARGFVVADAAGDQRQVPVSG